MKSDKDVQKLGSLGTARGDVRWLIYYGKEPGVTWRIKIESPCPAVPFLGTIGKIRLHMPPFLVTNIIQNKQEVGGAGREGCVGGLAAAAPSTRIR